MSSGHWGCVVDHDRGGEAAGSSASERSPLQQALAMAPAAASFRRAHTVASRLPTPIALCRRFGRARPQDGAVGATHDR